MTVVKLDFVSRRIGTMDNAAGIAPDPEYVVLTSKLFPVVVDEAMDSAGAQRNGYMYGFIESADVGGAQLGGALEDVIVFGTVGPDSTDISAEYVSGVLEDIVLFASAPSDEMNISAEYVSGELRRVIVEYYNWAPGPESTDISGTQLGGTLV